jgi:peroxiredoxin
MNLTDLPTNLSRPDNDGGCDHLLNSIMPDISLPTQDNNLLKLNRKDTFRLVIFCYPMTGRPDRSLPENWNSIPGARGCTSQNCSFRDNYDNLIVSNALPIGVSTQSVFDIKEMTTRLKIPYDVVSDQDLSLITALNLPTFTINDKKFFKRVTIIVDQSIIKKVFYPIFPPHNNINEVLDWLNKNP